ncbi:MAG: aminotransferase class V-fold PLP-dependent enzyme, partial [Candidatus Aenigmarchaeota archaeon]|nr:aminotransferase class V-fold PLP-dependent enzyme [Candidatus Aenigmarchaeota archaeon]
MDVEKIRQDFPILKQMVHGKPLVYLDNAATSQKPKQVIEKLKEYYENYNANIHRGIYALSERATEEHEMARAKATDFINAKSPKEVIFTRNATESLNLLAYSLGGTMKSGDNIVCTVMEHHSNLIPFQVACDRIGAKLVVIPITDKGDIDMVEYQNLVTKYAEKIKLISVCHISNVLGTINPIKEI